MKLFVYDKEVSIEELKKIFDEWDYSGDGFQVLQVDEITKDAIYFVKEDYEC